jgi:hypothetical protein
MLIVLESPKKVVVFGKGLVSSCFGHVESSILHFLAPKGDSLLSFVSGI